MARALLELPKDCDGRVWHYANRTVGRGGEHAPVHHHAELEINLITSGAARYLVDDRLYDLTPGTQIWLYPAQEHVLIEQSPDFTMWIVVFTPAMVQRVCTEAQTKPLCAERPTGLFSKQLSREDAEQLDSLFAQLAHAPNIDARFNAGLTYLLLSAWAIHLRSQKQTVGADVHPAIERAARMIDAETDPIGVEVLADRCGLSPSRLSRLFKQQTGLPLVRYRQNRQLERFLDIYGRGRKRNVTEAALAAGFGSYAQFHRVFKQIMGMSPAAYRRQIQADEAG